MPAPSPQESNKYAIRKSQSVGGFSPSANNKKVKAKETPSLKTKFHHNNTVAINENDTENDATPVASPEATPITGRKKTGGSKKLGNLFKWFRNESNTANNTGTVSYYKNQ